jgi:hypothetical protein
VEGNKCQKEHHLNQGEKKSIPSADDVVNMRIMSENDDAPPVDSVKQQNYATITGQKPVKKKLFLKYSKIIYSDFNILRLKNYIEHIV